MNTIIKLEAEWNGAHCSLENVDYVLHGWAQLPTPLAGAWAAYAPFVDITLDADGNIVDMTQGLEIKADPVPEPPLKPTVEELAHENKRLKAQLQAQTDRGDFVEDCVAEMAAQVYSAV